MYSIPINHSLYGEEVTDPDSHIIIDVDDINFNNLKNTYLILCNQNSNLIIDNFENKFMEFINGIDIKIHVLGKDYNYVLACADIALIISYIFIIYTPLIREIELCYSIQNDTIIFDKNGDKLKYYFNNAGNNGKELTIQVDIEFSSGNLIQFNTSFIKK